MNNRKDALNLTKILLKCPNLTSLKLNILNSKIFCGNFEINKEMKLKHLTVEGITTDMEWLNNFLKNCAGLDFFRH